MYKGDVYYANDAFDGLKFMNTIMEYKRKGERPELKIYIDPRKDEFKNLVLTDKSNITKTVKASAYIPTPPFWGSRIVTDIPIEKAFEYINEIALFRGSWNVYKDRNKSDEEYNKLIDLEIRPKLNELKLKAKREKILTPTVIYGYYPCKSDGNDLIIYKPNEI